MHAIGGDCDKCGFCVLECPVDAIEEGPAVYRIVPEKCVECGACVPVCPLGVIVERAGPDARGDAP